MLQVTKIEKIRIVSSDRMGSHQHRSKNRVRVISISRAIDILSVVEIDGAKRREVICSGPVHALPLQLCFAPSTSSANYGRLHTGHAAGPIPSSISVLEHIDVFLGTPQQATDSTGSTPGSCVAAYLTTNYLTL